MNTHSQHKDILFLVSLSPEIITDLEKKEIDLSYYLNQIKSFTNVDYRETISRENLAIANQYKIVIVVGHRKGDSLELSNRSLFPMADIATSLPSDFSGVIDVSVCNSTVIHDAIKKRCPNALVQTADEETGVDFRIPLYSILLKHLPADINYYDAYHLLLEVMWENQNSIPKQELDKRPTTTKLGEEDALRYKKKILSLLLGRNMSHNLGPTIFRMLGGGDVVVKQKKVSILSPKSVIRRHTFYVRVFLYYDSQKGTIELIADFHVIKPPLPLETIKDIHKGDKIDIKFSMMDVHLQPTNLILVCGKGHSYTKQSITISDKLIEEVFDVLVTEEYNYSECCARLEIRKSDASEVIKPLDYIITIKEEDGQHSNNTEKQYSYNEGLANGANLAEKQKMNLDAKPAVENVEYEEAMPDDQSAKCFRHTSELVRQQVKAVVIDFYLGSAAYLALIEIACFDHGLLLRRNNHKAFVETLMAWGAMTCTDVKKTTNGISSKMRNVPKCGYKDWVGDGYVNDKKTCIEIGKKLGPKIPYSRNREE